MAHLPKEKERGLSRSFQPFHFPHAFQDDLAVTGPAALPYRTPTVDSVAILANRWLKFRFSPTHQRHELEQWLARHTLGRRRVAATAAQPMALANLKQQAVGLWNAALAPESFTPLSSVVSPQSVSNDDTETKDYRQDARLTTTEAPRADSSLVPYWDAMFELTWLAQELQQTDRAVWLTALLDDLQQTGNAASLSPLHQARYQYPLPFLQWEALLTQAGYDTTWLQDCQNSPEKLLDVAVLATLALQPRPFPWSGLLQQVTQTRQSGQLALPWENLPYLQYAAQLLQALQQQGPLPNPPGGRSPSFPYLWDQVQQRVNVQLPQTLTQPAIVRPVRLLVLVEGMSETILLPALAEHMQFPLRENGVRLRQVGGKHRVQEAYNHWASWLRSPILLLLDADARSSTEDWLAMRLREQDAVFYWPNGELEDEYPRAWLATLLSQQPEWCGGQEPAETVYARLVEQQLPMNTGNGERFIRRCQELQWVLQQLRLEPLDKPWLARQLADILVQSPLGSQPLPGAFTDWLTTVQRLVSAAT